MAKGEFYRKDTVLGEFPGLSAYLPAERVRKIGISKSGNIKYTVDSGELCVIPGTGLPERLYREINERFGGSLLPDEGALAVEEGLPYIRAQDFRKLFPGTDLPSERRVCIRKEGAGIHIIQYKTRKKKQTENEITPPGGIDGKHIALKVIREIHEGETTVDSLFEKISENRGKYSDIADRVHVITGCTAQVKTSECGILFMISIHGRNGSVDEICLRRDLPEVDYDRINTRVEKLKPKLVKDYNDRERAKAKTAFVKTTGKSLEEAISAKWDLCHVTVETGGACAGSGTGILRKGTQWTVRAETRDKTPVTVKFHPAFPPEIPWSEKACIPDGTVEILHTRKEEKTSDRIVRECMKILKTSVWEAPLLYESRTGTVFNKEQTAFEKLEKKADPLLFGKIKREEKRKSAEYFPEADTVRLETSLFVITSGSSCHVEIKTTPAYREIVRETEMKKAVSAKQFLRQLEKQNFTEIEIRFLSGKGILKGNTAVMVSTGEFRFRHVWKTGALRDSLPTWRKTAERNIREISAEYQKLNEEKQSEIRFRLNEFSGSFLAVDIASFIQKNERYITQNATVGYLRGLRVRFSGDIADTGRRGAYSLLSSESINRVITDMKTKGVLTYKTLSGTYGKFDILKPTEYSKELVSGKYNHIDTDDVAGCIDKGEKINDFQAEAFFLAVTKQETISNTDYIRLLGLISSTGFVCRYYTNYTNTLKKAPEEVKILMKMRKELAGSSLEKKVLTEALKKK